jgi:hypothetical protein
MDKALVATLITLSSAFLIAVILDKLESRR